MACKSIAGHGQLSGRPPIVQPVPPPPRRRHLPALRHTLTRTISRASQSEQLPEDQQQQAELWEPREQAQAEYQQAQKAYQKAFTDYTAAQQQHQGAQQSLEQTRKMQEAQREYRQASAAYEIARANYEDVLRSYQGLQQEYREAQQEYLAAQQALRGPTGRRTARAGFVAGWLGPIADLVQTVFRWLLRQLGEVPRLLREFGELVRGAAALAPQLYYPSFGFVFRRTVVILLVVAFLLVYVTLVDRMWSNIPRAIAWSEAHPGWGRRALQAAWAAARQRLAGG